MIKIFSKHILLLNLVICASFLFSCTNGDNSDIEDNGGTIIAPGKELPDPTGTVVFNLMQGDEDTEIKGFVPIHINNAYNFEGRSGSAAHFVSLGKMKGLGNVTYVPQEGWNSTVAVTPGEGYVARCCNYYDGGIQYAYARLYVVSEIVGTSSGVIGYKVKCQAPFELAPKFTTNSIEFDADENLTKNIEFVNPTSALVKSSPDWCTVVPTENGFRITVLENITDSEYSGSIEIENSAGTVNIEIKQKKSANPKFAKGRGTKKSPWIICTPAQLNEVRNYATGYFEVANDIDLTPYLQADGTGWKPIEVFNGHFDGKKHVIKGLWISLSSVNNIGLFAKMDGKNSKISNVRVMLDSRGICGNGYVGGICGYANMGTIEGCRVEGEIKGSNCVGGILGDCAGSSTVISQSFSTGSVIASTSYYPSAGGISGSNGTIENCYSDSDVRTTGSNGYVMGIGGGTTSHCYFAGTIKGEGSLRPITHSSSFACYYNSDKINVSSANGMALTTSQMKKRASYQDWDFDKVWKIDEGKSYPKLRVLE